MELKTHEMEIKKLNDDLEKLVMKSENTATEFNCIHDISESIYYLTALDILVIWTIQAVRCLTTTTLWQIVEWVETEMVTDIIASADTCPEMVILERLWDIRRDTKSIDIVDELNYIIDRVSRLAIC